MQRRYTLRVQIPEIATYRQLRSAAGLSPKTEAAARIGLANGLYSVMVFDGDRAVGMGRVVGDGGCFFQVVDIAVMPDHQGQGLGKQIMSAIAAWLQREVPASGYVSLIADGQAHQLYAQYGFQPTAPASIGMAWMPND
jgi:GNAT superfamily N-acetyltransferase